MKTAVIIGMGRMGREHERAYRECGVEVVARSTKDTWRGDVDSLHPDYVSVCSYDDAHADQICFALERWCKVIAEKPLCLAEDDLRRIYKLATPENLYCNLPLLEKDWPACADAEHIQAHYYWGRVAQLPGWRGNVRGYSFVLGAGVHMISLAMQLKGRAIGSVFAQGEWTSKEIDCATMIDVDGTFVGGGTMRSIIECATPGQHAHDIHFSRPDGLSFDVRNLKTDKTAGIKRFIEGKYDRFHNSFAAHSVCFAIERALKSGKRETVEYLHD
jgi:predicted dehydrogenase